MQNRQGSLQANIDAFDQYYEKPAWWFRWRYDTQVKRKSVLALLRRLNKDWAGKRIFELGFGSGEVLFSFPTTCEIHGVELSSTALTSIATRAAAKGYHHFHFAPLGKEMAIGLPNEHVDLAIASHVLEHVEDDVVCLREVRRILKPGGALAVLIPLNERYEDPNHMRRYTSLGFRTICEKEGFTFLDGFENELLFYVVERMYWNNLDRKWSIPGNVARALFNVLTSRLPFGCYNACDSVIKRLTGLPPRQSALLFIKTGANG